MTRLISIAIAMQFAACAPSDDAIMQFDHAFELVEAIPLEETILINGVSDVEILSNARMLVADMQGSMVALYGSQGELMRRFDTSTCDPEADFQPRKILHLGRGRFIASFFAAATHEFDIETGCVRALQAMTPPPRDYCVDGRGNVAAYYFERPRGRVVTYDGDLSPTDTLFLPETNFLRLNTTYHISGYLACLSDGRVYYAYPESSQPLDIRSNQPISDTPPEFYQPLADDVEHAPSGVAGFRDGMDRTMASGTSINHVYALEPAGLMTNYRLKAELSRAPKRIYRLTIGDRSINVEQMGLHQWIRTVSGEFFYAAIHPGSDVPEHLSEYADHENPVILKYRLRDGYFD